MEPKAASITTPEDTCFASAARSEPLEIQHIHALVESAPNVQQIMDAMPFVVLLLNGHRQIVAANQKVCSLLGVGIDQALGKRPGELIGCIHSVDGPNGCGTGVHCKVCGAVKAILDTIDSGNRITEECRITQHSGDALDWEVTTSPVTIEGHDLICLAVQDISHLKRRNSLERTFFHDIINQIGAISGFVKLMTDDYDQSNELKEVVTLTNELLEEVLSHRNLSLAENGDLEPKRERVELSSLLSRLAQLYQRHPSANGKTIVLCVDTAPTIQTDPQLLKRIVSNMIKNALEASTHGQTVTLTCEDQESSVSIHVHNAGVIPEHVQLEIFNRSFTTKKGAGRGVGTYSMKLLGERYLDGRVEFKSSPDLGTVFTITLPKSY